jgi:hypothetical protein
MEANANAWNSNVNNEAEANAFIGTKVDEYSAFPDDYECSTAKFHLPYRMSIFVGFV